MDHKYRYLLIFILAITMIYVFSSKKDCGGKEMELNMIKVCGVNATKDHEKPNVGLTYFKQLKKGTTYEDIVNAVGKPTGTIGFGFIRPYYAVEDVYVVMYFSYTQEGEYDKLLRMEVCNEDEKLYELKLN